MSSKVLIVGGGPSGLVLALTLLRNGVPVRIIEKQSKYQIGARGRGMQPRTFEMYEFLGIVSDIIKSSNVIVPVHEYPSPQGDHPPQKIEMAPTWEDTAACPYNNPRAIAQDNQEAILRKHLLKDYGCELELGTELRSFEQHPDRVVAQIVKVGSDNEEIVETATFDWLVGADGAHSIVRKQLGLTFLGESPARVEVLIGDIKVKTGLDQEAWRSWGEHTNAIASLRPSEIPNDDRYSFYIRGADVDVEKVASSREEIIKTLHEISGRKDIEFGDLICAGVWRPNIRMVNKFSEGRVFVAGDSAHVHSPTGGQGMNSGVQDAFNLGWKLALVAKGLSPASILESYSNERIPVISSMLNKTTTLFEKTFKSRDSSAGWVRGYELRQLGVNYRGSALILDEKHKDKEEVIDPYRSGEDGTVRGGDRAPDAPGLVAISVSDTKKTRFFNIFRPTHHTVLVFSDTNSTSSASDIVSALSSYPKGTVKSVLIYPGSAAPSTPATASELADLVLVDSAGHAYKNYNVTEQGVSVVIVRPDGYIGALVGGTSGVEQYFGRFFA